MAYNDQENNEEGIQDPLSLPTCQPAERLTDRPTY